MLRVSKTHLMFLVSAAGLAICWISQQIGTPDGQFALMALGMALVIGPYFFAMMKDLLGVRFWSVIPLVLGTSMFVLATDRESMDTSFLWMLLGTTLMVFGIIMLLVDAAWQREAELTGELEEAKRKIVELSR